MLIFDKGCSSPLNSFYTLNTNTVMKIWIFEHFRQNLEKKNYLSCVVDNLDISAARINIKIAKCGLWLQLFFVSNGLLLLDNVT